MELTNVFSDRARKSPNLQTADNHLSAVGKTLKVVGSAGSVALVSPENSRMAMAVG
jgi:hypothetical protein